MTPLLTVVIPTRNRRDQILRLLRAIAGEDHAPPIEVVVVDDGSTDGTVAALEAVRLPFDLRVLSQQASGPAAARNAGATAGRGALLLFLDDDMEPLPGTLASHVAFHAERDHSLGVGDLPPIVPDRTMLGITLRGWWERMLHDVRKPGHRFGFRNVLSGHLSVSRERFLALGGFDSAFRCHEDWEFGYRAIRSGMQVRFVPGAIAHHHETSDLHKIARRKFDEGVADVQLSQRHPELGCVLPIAWPPASRKARAAMHLAWVPHAETMLTTGLQSMMQVAERLHMRGRWRAALELLLTYWYWRGVQSTIARPADVAEIIRPAEPPTEADLFLDLGEGLDHAEARLDEVSPLSAALFYRGMPVGLIPAVPGLERLRGEHLRPMLTLPFYRWALGEAARRVGAVPPLWTRPWSADAGWDVPDARAPLVGDEELSSHVRAPVDAQHRPTIPPAHRVA